MAPAATGAQKGVLLRHISSRATVTVGMLQASTKVKIANFSRHLRDRQQQLDWPAGIIAFKEFDEEGGHLSVLGAALSELVGHVVGYVAGPTFRGVDATTRTGLLYCPSSKWRMRMSVSYSIPR